MMSTLILTSKMKRMMNFILFDVINKLNNNMIKRLLPLELVGIDYRGLVFVGLTQHGGKGQ